jgi:hypothetical protein
MKLQETFLNSTINNSNQQMKSSEQFWKQFSTSIWEKETLAIKNSFINPPITADELFSIIVNDFNANSKSLAEKHFYIEGNEQKLEESDYYPTPVDGSFIEYDRRIRSICDGQEYVLVINCIIINNILWNWIYDFLQNLYNSLGYLTYDNFCSIFYGNYTKTPFGVHIDDNETGFYFPIKGRKLMRMWKSEFVRQNQEIMSSTKYEKFIKYSTLLEAEPGGVLYWPSDRWHIGASKGGDISLTIAVSTSNDFFSPLINLIKKEIIESYGENSLKLYFLNLIDFIFVKVKDLEQPYSKNSFKRNCWKPIRKFLLKTVDKKAFFNPNDLQKSAETLPDSIQSAANFFNFFINSSVVEIASAKLWLAMLTGYGFFPLVSYQFLEVERDELKKEDYIQLSPNRQILWKKIGKDKIVIAVNGIPKIVPLYPNIENIIKAINSGELQSVKSILDNSEFLSNEEEHRQYSVKNVLNLLNTLLRNGGIKIVK